jgi:hypothetical protein
VHDLHNQEGYFEPNLYNPAQAVRLYTPVLVNGAVRVVDPGNVPATLTTADTLPSNFEGLIVPNSGNPTNGMVFAKDGYLMGGYKQGLRVAPRFGFAWEPFKDTVVRGGFGNSYDRGRTDQDNNEAQVPPNVLTPVLYYGSLTNINAAAANGARGTIGLTAVSPADKTPHIYSFNLGIQRNVGLGIVVDVAYVGSLGRDLEQVININAVPYGATFKASAQDPTKYSNGVVPAVQPGLPAAYANAGLSFDGVNALPQDFLRPFTGYGDISYRNNGASSNYNSLQATVSRHISRGLVIGAAYTFSKNFLTNNSDSDSVNPFNTRAYEYRLAASDQTHNLVVSYVYNIPGASRFLKGNPVAKAVLDGWELSGISIFRSGTPAELSPSISGINSGATLTGSYTFGPMFYLTGQPIFNSNAGTGGDHINPAAFYLGQPGELSPWPRTYYRNPGTNNFDMSLFKNFKLGGEGKRYLQLRLEGFNAFNHTQFSGYNTSTNLTTASGATGSSVLNVADFSTLTITNNLRPAGSTKTLGSYFGEYNGTREQRIVQLGAKLYF